MVRDINAETNGRLTRWFSTRNRSTNYPTVWQLCRITRKMVHYQERSIHYLCQLQENDFLHGKQLLTPVCKLIIFGISLDELLQWGTVTSDQDCGVSRVVCHVKSYNIQIYKREGQCHEQCSLKMSDIICTTLMIPLTQKFPYILKKRI